MEKRHAVAVRDAVEQSDADSESSRSRRLGVPRSAWNQQ